VTETTQFAVNTRPYSGYTDPALPIASYIAQGTDLGTVTGGSLFLEFPFQLAAGPDVSNLYNLEQFAIHVDQNLNIGANLETFAMDHLAGPLVALIQRWSLLVNFGGGGLGNANDFGTMAGLPVWLGRPQTGLDAGLRFELINTLNVTYTATIQGYIWGPRSVLAQGGPQRPQSGYFR